MNGTYKLIIEDDQGQRSVVPVEVGEVSIGRAAESTIHLNERNVSRNHATLKRSNGSVVAIDLDSYNGTFVNGDRLEEPYEICQGDLIQIGDFQMELRGDGLPRAAEVTDRTDLSGHVTTHPGAKVEAREPGEGELSKVARSPAAPIEVEEKTALIRLGDLFEQEEVGASEGGDILEAEGELVGVSSHFPGERFLLDRAEVVLGRTSDNDIALLHRSVSRHHAKICREGSSYVITDLTSSNGTLVNGEEYARTELRYGDLIELGHVKFRFAPAEGGEHLWEQDLLELKGGFGRGKGPSGERFQGEAVRIGPVSLSRTQAFALLGVVVFGLALALIRGASEPRVTEIEETVRVESNKIAAARLLVQAQDLLEQRKWSQAEILCNKALEINPGDPQAQKMLVEIRGEADMADRYQQAKRLSGEGNWSEAWNTLSVISEDSYYFSDASKLRQIVRGGLISERVAEVRVAIKSRRWNVALELVDEIAGLNPEHPEIEVLRDQIKGGTRAGAEGSMKKPARGEKKKKSKEGAVRLEKPRLKKPPAAPQPKGKEAVLKPTFKPAPEVSVSVGPKVYYKEGVKALSEGAFATSIEKFSKCIQADMNYSLCYRAMGITYARMKNTPKAARYYRLYLKVAPDAKDAAKVRALLSKFDEE